MQASLRSHHHQQQQPAIQQCYEYQDCDPLGAPTYEAPIGAEQQSEASFDQALYQDQQQLSVPCGNIYRSSTSIYYDLSQNYGNNASQAPDEVDRHHRHHQHQLKVIELQETYHHHNNNNHQQQQHYVTDPAPAPVPAPAQEHQNSANYPTTAIYADPFAQTNCIPHDASYNQDYLTQPPGPYYATSVSEDVNHAHEHQCYQSQAAPLNYYAPSSQHSVHLTAESFPEIQQLNAGNNLYQSSQIDYQQLEEWRKQNGQQEFVGNQSIRATEQHQQSSQHNSFSSALSTSSSCITANSTKLFSNDDDDDEDDASYDDDESEDSTLPRDQKKAKEANIPLSYNEIVNLSIDQFNEHIARFQYTEAQLTLMKDIRRRGKNKVAAQTCRKRKMEQIMELQHEVGQLANKRMALSCDLNHLIQDHIRQANEYERLYSIIQIHLSKPTPATNLKGGQLVLSSAANFAAATNDHSTTRTAS